MLNYEIEPSLLRDYVPKGVELDQWNTTTYVSLVGFLFQRTRVLGIPFPWHTDFEEVNLRFYVRRRTPEGWRRGVVFVREIVSRRAIATLARVCYNEPYLAMPMRHRVETAKGELKDGSLVEYSWRFQGEWNCISARAVGEGSPLRSDSEEEFITEHYWGYTAQRNGSCIEYNVEHPRWNVYDVREATLRCDVAALYGSRFVEVLQGHPRSAFIADGSPVIVSVGRGFHC